MVKVNIENSNKIITCGAGYLTNLTIIKETNKYEDKL